MKTEQTTLPSPAAFWNLANAYRDAADAVFTKIDTGHCAPLAVVPAVFLCFRSIELSLKSVLAVDILRIKPTTDEPEDKFNERLGAVAKKQQARIAKQLGHRLGDLLDECAKDHPLATLGLDTQASTMLKQYSALYSNKAYEYSDNPWLEPDLTLLRQTSRNLCEATRLLLKKAHT